MARLNNLVKFIMINVNILASVLGLFFFGFALYLWGSNWGNLDPGFFLGFGWVIFLFGIMLIILSVLGCMGADHQTKVYANGWITARRITAVHLAFLVLALAGEFVLLRTSLSATQQYTSVVSDLKKGIYDPYTTYEAYIEREFDRFFFGAASECSKSLYQWFWNWIDNNCPVLTELNCQACHAYSLTFCQADENLCYSTSSQEYNMYCPYNICRENILNYFHVRVRAFAVILLAIILVTLFLILFDVMIICFHPRDTLEQILYKSGTLSKHVQDHHGGV